MKNVTIAVDEDLLAAAREYARAHGVSLNALIRQLLKQRIGEQAMDPLEHAWALADRIHCSTGGRKWRREDLYDV